ncbi:MAG: hypothetical protein FWH37_04620 [Candidatus Bathyarchaeota archaeon]|nr:hypothetical protein [Candidatus Termiticorpusculum sp.]
MRFCTADLLFPERVSGKNLRFIFEGLTEFLVGLVLKNTLVECYKVWQVVNPRKSCLSSLYLDYVNVWLFLSKKINFKEIIPIYFDVSLNDPLKSLDQALNSEIGTSYNMSFKEKMDKQTIFHDFIDALTVVYCDEFVEFQKSLPQIIEI